MPEYAFYVALEAVVRVKADTLEEAEDMLKLVDSISGPADLPEGMRLTEYSLQTDHQEPDCFEVDGKPTER